jgi:5-methylcytosine-specific restriction endonuclease McrA
MKRTPFKRRITPKARLKRLAMKEALDKYFLDNFNPVCQVCGFPIDRSGVDAHHKARASQGGTNTAENLVAVHRFCHNWIHLRGSRGPEETAVRESTANMRDGGVVEFTLLKPGEAA